MKKINGLLSLFFILLLIGCGATVTEPTPTPDEETPAPDGETIPESDIFPRPTVTPDSEDETYPAPNEQTEELEAYPPPSNSEPDAYPPPPPTQESYPGPESATADLIWVIRPVGEQCAEETDYADLQEAVADLIAVGVQVEASETTDLFVCQACGCPTSAHFRAQIPASDLGDAEQLGWLQEEP